ncbi:MAG: tetratricopeptide repeat protein [Oligoflexus sp.]
MILRRRLLNCLVVPCLWLAADGFMHVAAGNSQKRVERSEAPSAEHMANYFSESRQGISIENLKKAEELRLQTIQSINQLLKTNMPDVRKFELYLRLGELHSERHDYLRDLEMKEFETRYDKWEKAGRRGDAPEISYRRSQSALLQSANSFRQLVQEYPRHPRTDAALYSLAKTLLRLENDNAVLYFKQLIRTHRNSPLIPETYLALGEYYFYKHDMQKAMENYRSAMKYRESRVYPYAVYKLGWAHFNATPKNAAEGKMNIDRAVAAFKLVIKLSEADKGANRNLNLRQEAINDLIMVFAETERTEEALSYFRRIGENEAFFDMLECLGNIYVENGQNKKAVKIYSRLLHESPNRSRNPEIHLKLAELYDKMNQIAKAVTILNTMNTLYVQESSWVSANRNDGERLKEARDLTQRNIHRFGTAYHQVGYKTNRNPYLLAASQIYQIYLTSFPEAVESYELRYYLADLYFHFKKYDEAADEYYKVSRAKIQEPKYLKDAALNAVVAIRKIDEEQKYQPLPPLGQVTKPVELPRIKNKMIRMMDNYVELLPQEKDSFPMRYSAAQIYFEYGHYDVAIKRFDDLGRNHPSTLQGQTAVKMILGYYSERKDWKKLVDTSREYLKDENIIKAGMQDDILAMIRHGMFQLGVELAKQNKFMESAQTFVDFQREFPKAKEAEDALFNASINYYKEAKVEEALNIGKLLLQEYPRSKHSVDVALDIAQTNEAMANFPDAANFYKLFGLSFLKDARAKIALFNAATLFKGLNDHVESINLFERFIKIYLKDKLAVIAHREIAEQKEKNGDVRGAVIYFQRYASRIGKDTEDGLYASAKAGELMQKQGKGAQGSRELEKVRRRLVKKDSPTAYEARRIVARSLFRSLEPSFIKFKELKITDATRIEKEVQGKQNRLISLVKQFENIIEIGNGEFTVASLFRIGEMHENFANELFNAPPPKGASQVEIDQYRTSIEQVAFPLKEEGRKFFDTAYQRSKEVQSFTEWTRLTRNKMVELDKENFPMVSEKSTEASYLSHSLIWENAVSKLAE